MDKIYLNELSLDGQFNEVEEFLDAALPVVKCIRFVHKNNGKISKHSTFFNQKITNDKTWNDLRGMRGDKVRRIKSLLLSTTDNPPFWDLQSELKQDLSANYICNEQDVSATSLAEAAEDDGLLISFPHEDYWDRELTIIKNEQDIFVVPSAGSLRYLTEQLHERSAISFYDYLIGRYDGTRLDFSTLESAYGFQDFEKDEIRDCLQTFDKFVQLDSWDAVFQDQGLRYKKYSPASGDVDWFRQEKYNAMSIDKFRCINPKRCFGYRDKEVFHVLRMERDHRISDNG